MRSGGTEELVALTGIELEAISGRLSPLPKSRAQRGTSLAKICKELVAQTVASWNQTMKCLQQLDLLRREGMFLAA
jgi:hypothetical protein